MRKILSFILIFGVANVILISIVAKVVPHLFFKIPHVGFLLWYFSGCGSLPPYITEDMYQEGKTSWLKKGDVIISGGVKAGTTWMLFCSHQIRVKGNDKKYPFLDLSVTTPWPGFVENPGDTWEDKWLKMNTVTLPNGNPLKQYWDHPDYPFRIFKAHENAESFGSLVGGDKVKFVAIARNGLDTAASFVPFLAQHTAQFRQLWGGFPPYSEEDKAIIHDLMPGGIFESRHFGYVNSWWEKKHEDNVLLLHYSDVKRDLPGAVSDLAEFFGVELSPQEMSTVVNKCSFPYMKKKSYLFNHLLPLNPNFKGSVMEFGSMIRKGEDGDGSALFSDEEKAAWVKAEEIMYAGDDTKLKWARHGMYYSDEEEIVQEKEESSEPSEGEL